MDTVSPFEDFYESMRRAFDPDVMKEKAKEYERLRAINIKRDDTYTDEEAGTDTSNGACSSWFHHGHIIMGRSGLVRVVLSHDDGLWHEQVSNH